MQEGSKKAIIAALVANAGIAIAKFVGFLITRSAGLLAEAGHSLADSGNQALLLFGSKRAKRPADRAHPFGYGPERYFWSFVVALVLFSMGGLFALYEGISKVSNPHVIEKPIVGFAILIFAIALETYSFRTAIKEANHVRPKDKSWWWFIRNAKSPELPVVLLEDFGAEVGLILALLGLTMAEVTGNPQWDAVGSISIGILLVIIAAVLAIEMKGLLIGEAPTDDVQSKLEAAINSSPAVRGIIHMRTMHSGPDRLIVAAKVEFAHHLSVPELAQRINDAEAALRAAVPVEMSIYIEPDIRRAAASTPGSDTAAP